MFLDEGDDPFRSVCLQSLRRLVHAHSGDVDHRAQAPQESRLGRLVPFGTREHPEKIGNSTDLLVELQWEEGSGVVHDSDPRRHQSSLRTSKDWALPCSERSLLTISGAASTSRMLRPKERSESFR